MLKEQFKSNQEELEDLLKFLGISKTFWHCPEFLMESFEVIRCDRNNLSQIVRAKFLIREIYLFNGKFSTRNN